MSNRQMTEKTFLSLSELDSIIEERGSRIHKKFQQDIIKGIHNSKLLEILQAIKEKRKDSFRPALTSLACEAVGGNSKDADNAGLMFTPSFHRHFNSRRHYRQIRKQASQYDCFRKIRTQQVALSRRPFDNQRLVQN